MRSRNRWREWLRSEWTFRFGGVYVGENGVRYHRHAYGGGWVSECSDVDGDTYVSRSAMVGPNCTLKADSSIRRRVKLRNTNVGSGVVVYARCTVGSADHLAETTAIGNGCVIGYGSTLHAGSWVLSGTSMGYMSLVCPGAVVPADSDYGPRFRAPVNSGAEGPEVKPLAYYVLGVGYDAPDPPPVQLTYSGGMGV